MKVKKMSPTDYIRKDVCPLHLSHPLRERRAAVVLWCLMSSEGCR